MNANVILIKDQPYYSVTDEHGRFSISDVPPGEYTLKAWHEALGVMKKTVTVQEKQASEVDFIISPKGSGHR